MLYHWATGTLHQHLILSAVTHCTIQWTPAVSIYRFIYHSSVLSIYLSIYRFIYLSSILAVYLSIYRSIVLSIYRSIYRSIVLSIYHSIVLSIILSIIIYLSFYLTFNLASVLAVYLLLSNFPSFYLLLFWSTCLFVQSFLRRINESLWPVETIKLVQLATLFTSRILDTVLLFWTHHRKPKSSSNIWIFISLYDIMLFLFPLDAFFFSVSLRLNCYPTT